MEATIRKRSVPSRRRRDGLIQYAHDVTSQNGEDGILRAIFEDILPSATERWCLDVGAWDGKHLSNTYSLLNSSKATQWKGILVEADKTKFQELQALYLEKPHVQCICATVSTDLQSPNHLVTLLDTQASENFPKKDVDFVCIDVDGGDYWLLHDLLAVGDFRPKVICVEFNPTMPDDCIYIPPRSEAIRHGASLSALVELSDTFQYVLVETTLYNAFLVPKTMYEVYFQSLVPDTSIEALHESTMGTQLYQLYDGTLKLWGCKKLLWHRQSIDEEQLQVLSPSQRNFPFAPSVSDDDNVDWKEISVDMSPFCQPSLFAKSDLESLRQETAASFLEILKKDGFALVRGTGMNSTLCRQALIQTHKFLHEADEAVRRSCLSALDRARRGYSPMATENFASLIGQAGPNDLVRKFRMGPPVDSENSLLRPNVWPGAHVWNDQESTAFRKAIESYYNDACDMTQGILQAIHTRLVSENPELHTSLQVLSQDVASSASVAHTSILTLLGYRTGARHKKSQSTKKKRQNHPLVAAHTDVGVITVLLFDQGNCASLQRRTQDDKWENVSLPPVVPRDDPIFVVNIADCLSDLSGSALPSTLHRVVANPNGTSPRNCLALFVGLDPNETLIVPTPGGDSENMTYEEWRRQRIARAQAVLKNGS